MVYLGVSAVIEKTQGQINSCHRRIPGVRRLPLPTVSIICGLSLINAIIWAAVGIVLV